MSGTRLPHRNTWGLPHLHAHPTGTKGAGVPRSEELFPMNMSVTASKDGDARPKSRPGQGLGGVGGVSLRGSRPPPVAGSAAARYGAAQYNIFAASLNARSPLKKAIRRSLSHYHVSLEGKIGQEVASEGERQRWRRGLCAGLIYITLSFPLLAFTTSTTWPRTPPEQSS